MAAQTFSTKGSYTWVCPPKVKFVQVECWGGGGGGGGVTTDTTGSGGGGAGGAYVKSTAIPVVPGVSYAVTVSDFSNAGIGQSGNGVQGGSSWFNTAGTIFAEGGAGGQAHQSGFAGGVGSSASSIGDVIRTGGNGGSGGTFVSGGSGAGGGGAGDVGAGSNGGNGANGVAGTAGTSGDTGGVNGSGGPGRTTNGVGQSGADAGGGGAGGCVVSLTTDRNGGFGAQGQVRLTWTPPTPLQFNNYQQVYVEGDGMSVSEKIH